MMKHLGIIYAVIATALWGTHSVVGRYLHDTVSSELISFSRLFIGSMTLFSFVLLSKSGKLDIPKGKNLKSIFTLAVTVALNLILFHAGLNYTSANNAIVLESTAPIFVALLSPVFFFTRISMRDLGLSCVAFSGIVLVITSKGVGEFSVIGDSLELLAGFTWGLFTILTRKMNMDKSDFHGRLLDLAYILLASSILILPFSDITSIEALSAKDLLLLGYLGVFPTAISYGLWFQASYSLRSSQLAIMFNLAVVFTAINSYIFLDESHNILSVVGVVLILTSITIVSKSKGTDDGNN